MGKRLRKGFYWRGDVVWVRTDPIDKLPRSTGCRDIRAAYLWHDERQRVAASPTYAASLSASLGKWIVRTLDHKDEHRSEGTGHMYRVKLGHFARVWGVDSTLAAVTPDAMDAYIVRRRKEGAGDNTIWREWTCLRQLLKLAKRAGAYAGDISTLMPPEFSPGYVPVVRTLTVEDLPKLWAALRTDDERAWVAFVLATGADVGDVHRAVPEDWNPKDKTMRVRGTKTDTRDARVPILPHVEELFMFALERLPLHWGRASNGVGEACKRAGIPHLSPKDLRRTASSWLMAAGADQTHVSRFLRHKNDAMVRLVYGQIKPEELGTLLGSTSNAIPLQQSHGPLGGKADAGDLKGDVTRRPGGWSVGNSGTCADERCATGDIGSAKPLQPCSPGELHRLRKVSRGWFRSAAEGACGS